MDNTELFVYMMAEGATFLGKIREGDFNEWKNNGSAIKVTDVRGLQLRPEGNRVAVHIGPAYVGDTRQETVYIRPSTVEIVGELKNEDGIVQCLGQSRSSQMFQHYSDAVTKWRAAMSNITLARPSDMPRAPRG